MKISTYLIRIVLLGIFILGTIHSVQADDTGIHKARLIQQNDSTYILEVDVSQQWLWAIKAPILPARFKVSEASYIQKANWYVVRVTIISRGAPLNADDEIILPWNRNGADLTAIWQDGSIYKGLFIRDFNNIKVPLKQLLPFDSSIKEIIIEHALLAIRHLQYNYILIVFTLCIIAFFGIHQVLKGLFAAALGFSLAMLLAEWGFYGFQLIFSELLICAAIIYLSYLKSKSIEPNKHHLFLLLVLGATFGISYFNELQALELSRNEKVIGLFIFASTTLLILLLSATVFKIILRSVQRKNSLGILSYLTGSLGIALLLSLLFNQVRNNQLDILNLQESDYAKSYSIPANEAGDNQGSRPVGKPELTAPVMSYLNIEPYEVRHEILINARAAVQLLGVDSKGMFGIPVGSLIPIKEGIEEVMLNSIRIEIDSENHVAELINTDFVTLSAAGVLIRDTPIPESLDEGIIGITMIYETEKYPDNVNLQWNIISPSVKVIETTSVDPFGISTELFTDNDMIMAWENTLMSTPNTLIKNVEVKARPIPYFSYFVLLTMALLIWLHYRNHIKLKKNWMYILLALATFSFPFLRFTISLPFISQNSPSYEQSEEIIENLLLNVYKSFDVRNEEKVYDRLALSITGEKLTEIYLDNRRLLEFENRGGARARIEKVVINDIKDIERVEKNTYTIRTEWMVNGSVGHFGHTHYRKNWYNALITFTIIEDSWKIKDIELIEEKRVL